MLRVADGDLIGDSADAAVRQEIETFGAALRRSPARSVRVVNPAGTERHAMITADRRIVLERVMTITIPKNLRSVEFTELTLVDLNDVDVDRLLPHLWELIVKQGRMAKAPPNDADNYDHYRDVLAADPRLVGFDDEHGRKVLDGWLRSSIVRIGAKGRRSQRNADGLHPAADDRQLPGRACRRRGGTATCTRSPITLLIAELERRGADNPEETLREQLEEAIGAGVRIGARGQLDAGVRRSRHDIDINALLSLYFLEQFEPQGARPDTSYVFRSSAVPGATQGLASDLLDYLRLLRHAAERFGVRRRVRGAAVAAAFPAAACAWRAPRGTCSTTGR